MPVQTIGDCSKLLDDGAYCGTVVQVPIVIWAVGRRVVFRWPELRAVRSKLPAPYEEPGKPLIHEEIDVSGGSRRKACATAQPLGITILVLHECELFVADGRAIDLGRAVDENIVGDRLNRNGPHDRRG